MAIFSHKCPYCKTDNTAFVVHSFVGHKESEKIATLFATCNKCNGGVVTDCISNASETFKLLIGIDGDLPYIAKTRFFNIGEWHPKQKPIDIPDHLPDDVAQSFFEGCKVMDISTRSACGMFRAAIELSTKEIASDSNGVKLNLASRINLLKNQGKITSDIADWAHHIRLDGNEAMHASAPTLSQAEELKSLTEYFLRYVYTLPEQVRLAREKSKKEFIN